MCSCWPFGGQPIWAKQWIFAGAVLALLLALPILSLRRGGPLGIVLLAFVALGLVQLLPLQAATLAALSPAAAQARINGGLDPSGPLTLDTQGTSFMLLHYAACAMVFYTVASMRNAQRAAMRMTDILIAAGTLQAIYAISVGFTVGNNIWGWSNEFHGDRFAGTYVNPTNFGGLMALLVPIALGRAGTIKWPRLPGSSLAVRLAYFLDQGKVHRKFLFLAAAALMVGALLLSASRGALAALIAGIVVYAGLSLLGRRVSLRSGIATLLAFGCFGAVFAYGLGATLLQERMLALPSGLASRITIWTGAARIVEAFPLFGSGLGSYGAVHMGYHPTPLPTQVVLHAHSDLLELAAEVGLPMLTLALMACIFLMLRGVRCMRAAGPTGLAPIVAGLLASGAALAVRVVVDFDMQMTGSAIVVCAIAGTLSMLAFESGRRGSRVVPLTLIALGVLALLLVPRQFGRQSLERLWDENNALHGKMDWEARTNAVRHFGSDDEPWVEMSRLALRTKYRPRIERLRREMLAGNRLRVQQAPADGLAHAHLARRLSMEGSRDLGVIRHHAQIAARLAPNAASIRTIAWLSVLRVDASDRQARTELVRLALDDLHTRTSVIRRGVPLGLGLDLARAIPLRALHGLGLLAEVAHMEGDMYTVAAALERSKPFPGLPTHIMRCRVTLTGPFSRAVAVLTVKTPDNGTMKVGHVVVDQQAREFVLAAPAGEPAIYLAPVLYRNLGDRPGSRLELDGPIRMEPR